MADQVGTDFRSGAQPGDVRTFLYRDRTHPLARSLKVAPGRGITSRTTAVRCPGRRSASSWPVSCAAA